MRAILQRNTHHRSGWACRSRLCLLRLWFANKPGVARRQLTFFCFAKRK